VSQQSRDIIDRLNAQRPAIIRSLRGRISSVDIDAGSCVIEYEIGENLCHSTNIVQGGIVTAMLDAAMTHAAFAQQPDITGLASLEIKVSFLEPSLAGKFSCRGWIRRSGYRVAFLEGELYSGEGKLTATASTTAKLSRSPD
jgi:uncharacterized protein (TIGR00369 family)